MKTRKPVVVDEKRMKNKRAALDAEIEKLSKSIEQYDFSELTSFRQYPLSSNTKRGLLQCGYETPTEIQKESIGFALKNMDVLGAAKTGSGKTLAFIIPILECLFTNRWTQMDGLGALIITPTRELAYQIFEVLKKVGVYHDFSAGLVIGGKDLKFEVKRMDRCNIVICTPGRLLQHMDETPLFSCDNLKILVLDEADRILDMGFSKTMNAIIENLPPERQTLLFSATQTRSVKDLARLSLKDPVYVSVHENSKISTPESLVQSYIICEQHEKLNVLWSFIKAHLKQKMIVFMSTCKQVKYTFELFCRMRPGTTLLSLYGTLSQFRRMAIYDEFCRKQNAILFATDIASRGLDFPSVNWVVQLDCPEDVNTYIHRVGRTARFEKGGESLLVVLSGEEESMIKQLSDRKIPINKIEVNSSKMMSIQRKAEALCARDVNLKESAQRAFKAYVKHISMMKDKTVFNLKNIDNDKYSRSLGLVITPRVRFVEKLTKRENSISKKDKVNSEKPNEKDFNFGSDDQEQSDDSNDIMSVKKVWRFDLDEDSSNQNYEAEKQSKKSKKALTKAALAKRILKKGFKPNKVIKFNEEGDMVQEEYPTRQISEKAKELQEKDLSGIDIELAKEIMKEEDKIDKKLYSKLIKEKHRVS